MGRHPARCSTGRSRSGLNRTHRVHDAERPLLPWRDVASNIDVPLEIQGMPRTERSRRVDAIDRAGRPHAFREPPIRRAVRRHAQAHGARPAAGLRSRDAAARRAVRRARRPAAPQHADRARQPQPPVEQDRALRDARSRRGGGAWRSLPGLLGPARHDRQGHDRSRCRATATCWRCGRTRPTGCCAASCGSTWPPRSPAAARRRPARPCNEAPSGTAAAGRRCCSASGRSARTPLPTSS